MELIPFICDKCQSFFINQAPIKDKIISIPTQYQQVYDLVLLYNPQSNKLDMELKLLDEDIINFNQMKNSVNGDDKRHFQSSGLYKGFGITAKYERNIVLLMFANILLISLYLSKWSSTDCKRF